MISRPDALLIRHALLSLAMLGAAAGLGYRAFDLHLADQSFLQHQAAARHLRSVELPAHRGVISDRHGEPLAVSTPVASVWVHPREFSTARDRWDAVGDLLNMEYEQIEDAVMGRMHREFVYLRRSVTPMLAERVMGLEVPGVYLGREYRRYYPAGEVAGHLVGFTDVDDHGREGLELAFDGHLRGVPGKGRVVRDRLGRWVEILDEMRAPRAGDDLSLTIDSRLQYLAYRELKAAYHKHQARAASAVVLDARTGELLAAVNQPSFNPNDLAARDPKRMRNRVFTDLFEPGSTVKPFVVATALAAGTLEPDAHLDTSPGVLRIGAHRVHDVRNFGVLSVAQVLQKSSNVGASRIGLSLPPELLWGTLTGLGFGLDTASGFPGEAAGVLTTPGGWREAERATHSYGYGFSITPLQLARAYGALADGGRLPTVSIVRGQHTPRTAQPVLDPASCTLVMDMLTGVVAPGGTAASSAIAGYQVAGKTGTSLIASAGGYDRERFVASFAGVAPWPDPQLVMVVTVTDPQGDAYHGGEVAAPVFAGFMRDALPLLGVPEQLPRQLALRAQGQ